LNERLAQIQLSHDNAALVFLHGKRVDLVKTIQ